MSAVNSALVDNLTPFFLRRDEKVTAAMAYATLPKLFPNVTAFWNMNEVADGLVWDSSGQGRNFTRTGSYSFSQQGELVRKMVLSGGGHLYRASEAAFESTSAFSVMAWIKKEASGGQHIVLGKTTSITGTTNGNFLFVVGSSDNLNLTIYNGTSTVNHTKAAPIGEWFYGAATYIPSVSITLYMGTKDGWQPPTSNTTSIPASRNAATSTNLTIGGLSGGTELSSGEYGQTLYCTSQPGETLFRTYFEYTKALFF